MIDIQMQQQFVLSHSGDEMLDAIKLVTKLNKLVNKENTTPGYNKTNKTFTDKEANIIAMWKQGVDSCKQQLNYVQTEVSE